MRKEITNPVGKWLYEGSVAPVKYDDEWNTSDEETDDSTWIGEFDLRATYGVGFVESLPDIANGEMTEIMRKQPKYCFCGHIHSGCHGIQEFNGMKFSNVSLVNEDYVVSYKPLYLNV